MKTIVLICILLAVCASTSLSSDFTNRFEKLTTLDGLVLLKAKPLRVEQDSLVVFMHSTGIAQVNIAALPDDVRTALGFPTREELIERTQAQDRAKREADASLREAEESLKDVYHLYGKIVQVKDPSEGILIKGVVLPEVQFLSEITDDTGLHRSHVGEKRVELARDRAMREIAEIAESTKHNGLYYVAGRWDGVVDGDVWHGRVYEAGIRQYITVSGATRTVRRFAATSELASQLRHSEQPTNDVPANDVSP